MVLRNLAKKLIEIGLNFGNSYLILSFYLFYYYYLIITNTTFFVKLKYLIQFFSESKPSVRHVWSKTIAANETDFKLTIVWVDPLGVIQSALSDTVSLIHNGIHHTNYEHNSLDKAGVWKVKILADPDDTELYQLDFPVFPLDAKDSLADSLTEKFFDISSACVVKPTNVWNAKCALIHKFSDCQETDWSSIFPDPKSEIKDGFDENIGWLV